MLKIILQRFKNNAASFGLISIIGGFVTDVLQPIAPFSSYIFYASTIGTLIIFLTFLFKTTLRKKLSNSLVLALSIMIRVSFAMHRHFFMMMTSWKNCGRQSILLLNTLTHPHLNPMMNFNND